MRKYITVNGVKYRPVRLHENFERTDNGGRVKISYSTSGIDEGDRDEMIQTLYDIADRLYTKRRNYNLGDAERYIKLCSKNARDAMEALNKSGQSNFAL